MQGHGLRRLPPQPRGNRRVGAHRHRRSARQPVHECGRGHARNSPTPARPAPWRAPRPATRRRWTRTARTRPSCGALTSTGIKYTGSDASKPYPQTPTDVNSARYAREPPGSRATRRPSRAIRPTSTTTRRRRTSSSTSTTGSTSRTTRPRRRSRATARRSRASRRAARPRRPGRSTSTARPGSCSGTSSATIRARTTSTRPTSP